MRSIVLAAAMTLTACGGPKDAVDTAGGGGAAGNPGADIYEINCQVCHGESGEGGTGIALNDGSLDTLTDDDIRAAVNDGVGAMPSFSLSATDVDALIDFIRSEFGG